MFKINKFDELESTNKYAKNLVSTNFSKDIINNQVILAYKQTSGVGKMGAPWYSCDENLTTSIIVPYDSYFNNNTIGNISLVSCLCVFKALESYIQDSKELFLKWPNDVIYNNKKISGILVEVAISLDKEQYFIVGLGVNLNSIPSITKYPIECLSHIIGQKISVDDFLTKVLLYFQDYIKNIKHKNVSDEWMQHAYYLNKQVEVTSGLDKVTGFLLGITPEGYLKLKIDNQEKIIVSGSLSLNQSHLI